MGGIGRSGSLWRALAAAAVAFSCGQLSGSETVLRAMPVSGLEGVISRSGLVFDPEVSSDGGGSLRVTTREPTTFRLYELSDLDVEDARLIYRARLRTQDLAGNAYLEMWCAFPGMGEFFSRALQAPLSGTNDWSTQETPFFLEAGQKPERVKLNLVVDGRGTVWIDDIVLAKGPR